MIESPVSGLVNTVSPEMVVLTSAVGLSAAAQKLTTLSNEMLIDSPVPQKSGSTSVPDSLTCSCSGGAASAAVGMSASAAKSARQSGSRRRPIGYPPQLGASRIDKSTSPSAIEINTTKGPAPP